MTTAALTNAPIANDIIGSTKSELVEMRNYWDRMRNDWAAQLTTGQFSQNIFDAWDAACMNVAILNEQIRMSRG